MTDLRSKDEIRLQAYYHLLMAHNLLIMTLDRDVLTYIDDAKEELREVRENEST